MCLFPPLHQGIKGTLIGKRCSILVSAANGRLKKIAAFHLLSSSLNPREGNGNPLQCSCLENPRDGRAWWAAISGVTQGRTRLKRLRSSSSKESNGFSFSVPYKEHKYQFFWTLTCWLHFSHDHFIFPVRQPCITHLK